MTEVIQRAAVIPAKGEPADAPRNGIANVWRDTLETFSAHAGAILVWAIVGFARLDALNPALTVAPSPFCAFRVMPDWPLLIPAVAAALLSPLATGVIACMALQGAHSRIEMRPAIGAVLSRLPALLLGWTIYNALMAGVAVGLVIPLRGALPDVFSERPVQPGLAQNMALSEMALRAANALVADPGFPYCELAGVVRIDLFNRWTSAAGGTEWHMVNPGTPYAHLSNAPVALLDDPALSPGSPLFWAIAAGSLTLLVLAEGLLHFRVAAAVCPAALVRSAPSIGARRWRRLLPVGVAVQIVLLRLLLMFVQAVLIGLPMTLIPHVAGPYLSQLASNSWVQPACLVLTLLSLALVNALLMAFCTVFDARLYLAIQCATRLPLDSADLQYAQSMAHTRRAPP